jgi:beta-galactosidase
MDFNWKFAPGNANDQKADFDLGSCMTNLAKQNLGNPQAFGLGFNDSKWQTVNLPHDWGMTLPFTDQAEGRWGSRPLGRQFPDTSIGWYRKTFKLPATDRGRRISVEFEGVCHDCVVEVNGFFVGTHFSGYTSFSYDITDFLHYGGDNVIAVRVDARANEGWWYQGAGIYRHVWLTKTSPVCVPLWGTQVLSRVDGTVAHVTVKADVANNMAQAKDATVQSSILDDSGQVVATGQPVAVHVEPWGRAPSACVIDVPNPKLWSLDAPMMYRVSTSVKVGDAQTDVYETPFGIRTISFDPDKGFFLNGQPVRIKGYCDHEQHAIVGVAMPDSLWPWEINKLKTEVGGNAIRTSHNAPSPALLDACDRQGILVMDEQRLFSSGEEGLKQLDSLVERDRNHPSIVIWSAGNEEWAEQSSPDSIPVMQRLQDEFHRLDPTRPVTFAASNGGDLNGLNKVADVRGINYLGAFNKNFTPEQYHQQMPTQPIIGTEEGMGDDGIKAMQEYPWYSGAFIWTGFAYYGEAKWPYIVAPFGLFDICGFPNHGNYERFQKAWGGQAVDDSTSRSPAASVRLDVDRSTINADGEDTAVVNINVVDSGNKRVGGAKNQVTVQLTGPGTILGVGNGDSGDLTLDQGASHVAFDGRAQVLIRATHEAGTIHLDVTSDGLQDGTADITTQAPQAPVPYVP